MTTDGHVRRFTRRQYDAPPPASLDGGYNVAAKWLRDLALDGPDLTAKAHVKCAHEAQELADNPSLGEAADVFIALVGTCIGQGWSRDDLALEIAAKVAVNRARLWSERSDGTWQHQ